MRLMVLAAAVCVGSASLSVAAEAQARIPRSQAGSVSQTIAGTRIDVVYRRPVARGRDLFGALVPYGRIWTPSADSAARITLSGPVMINDARLEAGEYAMWALPDSSRWMVIFSKAAARFHLSYPEGQDALRVQAPVERGDHVETLAFYFPMADADSATLRMHWGRTIVPLRIKAIAP